MFNRAAAILLVVGMVIIGPRSVVAQNPTPQTSQQAQSPNEASTGRPQSQPDETFWQRSTRDPVALFTLWVALFTAGLFVSTVGLWIVTYFSLRHARKTAEAELRAYVAVLPGGLRQVNPNENLAFLFNMLNGGRTPAYNVEYAAVVRLLDHPLPANFPFPALPVAPHSRLVIPNGVPFQGTVVADRRFTQNEIAGLLQAPVEGTRLYVFGRVDYTDALGVARWTRFCLSFPGFHEMVPLAQQGDWTGIAQALAHPFLGLSFEFAAQHNEAT